eukprot:359765-Chlamydomonas_euryale.AAC.5
MTWSSICRFPGAAVPVAGCMVFTHPHTPVTPPRFRSQDVPLFKGILSFTYPHTRVTLPCFLSPRTCPCLRASCRTSFPASTSRLLTTPHLTRGCWTTASGSSYSRQTCSSRRCGMLFTLGSHRWNPVGLVCRLLLARLHPAVASPKILKFRFGACPCAASTYMPFSPAPSLIPQASQNPETSLVVAVLRQLIGACVPVFCCVAITL